MLREEGYAFRFRSSDGGEPPHVHVDGHSGAAKIWLSKTEVASSRAYTAREIRQILDIVEEHRDEFLAKWNDFFGR